MKWPIEVDARSAVLGMPASTFLKRYWQKQPVLIRNAFSDFTCPITPNDLAGLATLDSAPSRIVRYQRKSDRWAVSTGPFADDAFAKLGSRDWTLLVQDVDKHDDDVRALLDRFAFVPSWRLDDVMISYAVPGGSVGAHIDRYDVFLLQGQGTRRWEIDVSPNPDERFRDDAPIKLLRSFKATHAFDVRPGDMLYLPPNVPHHGVAVDECLTLSIGMRAPGGAELLATLGGELLQGSDALRYSDADLRERVSPSEIVNDDVRRLRQTLAQTTALDDDALGDFFARFLSQYRQSVAPKPRRKAPDLTPSTRWQPAIRLNWRQSQASVRLYGDGCSLACSERVARCACGEADFAWITEANSAERAALLDIWKRGWVQACR